MVFAGTLPDLPVSSSRRNSSPSSSSSGHLKCHQELAAGLAVWLAVEEEGVVEEVVAVVQRVLLDHLHCLETQMAAVEDTWAWPRPPPGWSILHSHRLPRRFPSHASLPTGCEGPVRTSKRVTELRLIIGGDGGGRTSPPKHPRLVKSQTSEGLKKNKQETELRMKICFRGGSIH